MKSKTTQRASAILLAIITALAAVFTLPSCTGFDGDGVTFPGINLPIDIGVVYPLEDGLAIQVGPADEGGLEVALIGEGQLTDNLKKFPGGFSILSSKTGVTYRITEGARGKPLVTIIAPELEPAK